MITLKSLQEDYSFFKCEAYRMTEKGFYGKALDAIRTAGTIAQNFCLHYADDDLESLLSQIAGRVLKAETVEPVKGRILFYDSFARDNAVLSIQYIRAFISWGREFMYVTPVSLTELKRQRLYMILRQYAGAEIVCFESKMKELGGVKKLFRQIIEYKPEKALLQFKTEDIVGLLPWYVVKGIQRYYIDVTDHSFWFGTKAIDRCIVFRNYGYSIALKYRGLKNEQILIQPFYSSTLDGSFEGIPSYIEGGVKLFSGGRITKIIGENDAFFYMIKRILDTFPNTEFYFAGGGLLNGAARMGHAEKFIKDNRLERRFHLLGQRTDIRAIAEHMDIFINTYPFGGGLMVQLAARCGLPIVIYAKNGLCSSIEEFLRVRNDAPLGITFLDDSSYYQEIRRLISDTDYRHLQGERNKSYVLTPKEFNHQLKDTLEKDISQIIPLYHEVDYEDRRRINIEAENRVLHRYHGILLRSSLLRKRKPFRYMREAVCLVVKSDKKYLYNTVKKIVMQKIGR